MMRGEIATQTRSTRAERCFSAVTMCSARTRRRTHIERAFDAKTQWRNDDTTDEPRTVVEEAHEEPAQRLIGSEAKAQRAAGEAAAASEAAKKHEEANVWPQQKESAAAEGCEAVEARQHHEETAALKPLEGKEEDPKALIQQRKIRCWTKEEKNHDARKAARMIGGNNQRAQKNKETNQDAEHSRMFRGIKSIASVKTSEEKYWYRR